RVRGGQQEINGTRGYKAVYPDEAIQAPLASLPRRRALRPTEESRVPSDAEWEQFLGHFEHRKVATGICGRAFGTPCIHEHSCLRCSMHWPDPAQRPRIAEIRGNLIARIAEAEREGWLGEVEGLKVSLAGAEDKLAQIDRRSQASAPVSLGMPRAAPRKEPSRHRSLSPMPCCTTWSPPPAPKAPTSLASPPSSPSTTASCSAATPRRTSTRNGTCPAGWRCPARPSPAPSTASWPAATAWAS